MVINIDSIEQSRARLQLQPTPRCAGSASPDPEAMISASPDPWVCAPSRPTETHTAADHSRSKRMGLGQNSDTREEIGTP